MRSGYDELPAVWLDQITVYSDHCVFWVTQGRAHIWADDRSYEVGGSEALVLPAGTTVGPFRTEAGSVALFVLLPRGRSPDPPARVVAHRLDDAASDALVAAYVRWIMPFWTEHPTVDALAVLSRSPEVIGTIGYPPLPGRPPARDVATVMLTEPADNRSAREWAGEVGTSERHLTRSFRAETGMTFSAWRTSLRVAHAVRLLREGVTPRDTAAAVGYGSTAALDHAFRRATGLSPSDAEALTRDPGGAEATSGSLRRSCPANLVDRPSPGRGGEAYVAAGPYTPRRPTTWPRIDGVHQLVWELRGSSEIEVGATTIRLDEGEAIWLPAGVGCRIRTEEGGIVVPVGELPADHPVDSNAPMRIPPRRAPEMFYRSAATYTCLRPDPYDAEHLADLLGTSGRPAVRSGRCPPDPLDRILAAPVSDSRSLGEWAAALGIPADRLARRFRARTGRSFPEWRGDRRMASARELLTQSNATPSSVAHDLGYSQLSAFTRAFTRHHDATPTAFQQEYRHVALFIAEDETAS